MNDREIAEILSFFYPANPPGEINPQLRDLAGFMLHEALEGSKMMNLVPRPSGGPPGLAWLALQAVQAVWRSTAQRGKIYETVRRTVALKCRSQYEMAKMGL